MGSKKSLVSPEKSLTEKLKEASSHSLVYGIGSSLQALLGFIFIPIYTKEFSADTFGILTLILLIGTIGGSFFYFGGTSALSRSYYDYDDPIDRKNVVTTSLVLTLAGTFLQIIFGFFLSEWISAIVFKNQLYTKHIFYSFLLSSISIINNFFLLILRFERKSLLVILLNIGQFILSFVTIIYLLMVSNYGILAPIVGPIFVQLSVLVIATVYCSKFIGTKVIGKELIVQSRFGFYSVLIGINQLLLNSADKFFVNQFGTMEEVGIYSLAFRIGSIVNILIVMPFNLIWAPMRIQYHNDANSRRTTKLFLTYYFLVGNIFCFALSMFSKELLLLVSFRKEYYIAFELVPVILYSILIFGSWNILDIGITYSRKIYLNFTIMASGLLLYWGLNYLLIERLGYKFAAYSLLVVYLVLVMLVSYVSRKIFFFEIEYKRIILIFTSVFFVAISVSLDNLNLTIVVMLQKMLLMILYLIIIWKLVLDDLEKLKVKLILQSRIRKYK